MPKIKRYLVFACAAYYPAGGWGDHKGSFNDRATALAFARAISAEYNGDVELIDLQTEKDIFLPLSLEPTDAN